VASFTIEEVLNVTGGTLLSGSLRQRARRLKTDSRELEGGDLFFALKGPHFDGHQFVSQAIKSGAIGAVVETSPPTALIRNLTRWNRSRNKPQPIYIEVKDALAAFQELARYHRQRFDIPVIAITGSNGKTTTKEMVTSTLKAKWRVLSTKGNLNNKIGLPQTLLRLHKGHDVTVIEMGVDQEGQTTRLCQIAQPTIGVMTNIGPDHLEFFGSIEGSARAKAELLAELPREGTVILNADDAFYSWLRPQVRCQQLAFGLSRKSQVRGSHVQPRGTRTYFQVSLPTLKKSKSASIGTHGIHNVSNALAALAVGHTVGMSANTMIKGLERFRPAAMRSQIQRRRGITIIRDCYNANPASMKAAIDLLVEMGKGKVTFAVLGDMFELGKNTKQLHREIGEWVAAKKVSCLIACGALGKEMAKGVQSTGRHSTKVFEVPLVKEASFLLKDMIRRGDVLLIKGSRGMKMEQVFEEGLKAPIHRGS